MKKIAVIGTGIMGNGIATNFLKNGYEVYVWNRNKQKLDSLVQKGAIIAESPKSATQLADIVFEVTADDESSKSVWLKEDGILAGANKNSILISSGTLSVSWVNELSKKCSDNEFTYFDIPLTGGRIAAENGELILLVGGDEDKLENLKPVLKAISSKIFYFGKVGSGARFKLVLNMLQAIHIVGLGEALKLAKKSGLDLNKVGDVLSEYPGGVLTKRAWQFFQTPPTELNFAIKWLVKDLKYAKDLAEDLPLPLLTDVLQEYSHEAQKGMGDEDWTHINTMD